MIFPLHAYELITEWLNLFFALIIGISFGVILERAGLGDAKKLIGQFLLKDLAVFKVMFSAIVTAMFGLFFLHVSGEINLSLINFSETYLVPQIIGGLILGIGFVIAGYCPGTTIVGFASGKIDALYSFIGLLLGSWIFIAIFEFIQDWYFSTQIVNDKLFQLTALNYGTVAAIIGSLAVGGFIVAEKIENKNE